jgi:hypothetical protein
VRQFDDNAVFITGRTPPSKSSDTQLIGCCEAGF